MNSVYSLPKELISIFKMNNSGIQTIQFIAWNGGVTPYINGDNESDLFQYYVGYSDSTGGLIPHKFPFQ